MCPGGKGNEADKHVSVPATTKVEINAMETQNRKIKFWGR